MRPLLLVHVMVVATIGGCLTEAPTTPDTRDVSAVFGGIQLNSCSTSIAQQSFLGTNAPGSAPPGWEYSLGEAGRFETKVEIQAIECTRLSVMDLEREARLIFEYHSNFYPPEKCMEGDWNEFVVLNQVVSDDVEVAGHLRGISIPVKAASISHDVAGNLVVPTHNWAWTVSSGGASELMTFTPNPTVTGSPQTLRLAWWDGEKLHMLDLRMEETFSQVPVYAVLGNFSSDMLISAPGTRTGPIQGGAVPFMNATSTYHVFGDPTCETLLV